LVLIDGEHLEDTLDVEEGLDDDGSI